MHIIEIVLDGFKSYATRTVITDFDPQFNAITGLNGSGKSNVLDSICFVLGISNLSQVRGAPRAACVSGAGRASARSARASTRHRRRAGAREQPQRAHLQAGSGGRD
jgi:structural maintenance of chromosome 2